MKLRYLIIIVMSLTCSFLVSCSTNSSNQSAYQPTRNPKNEKVFTETVGATDENVNDYYSNTQASLKTDCQPSSNRDGIKSTKHCGSPGFTAGFSSGWMV